VKNVQAQDLLVNGTPATNVVPFAPDVYVFEFPPQAPGATRVEWSTGQQIVDLTSSSNRFAGGQYSYTVDPAAASDPVIISEFMAANTSTIRDDDGKWSDWIELYNSGDSAVSLSGWYLSDDPTRLTKWRFRTALPCARKPTSSCGQQEMILRTPRPSAHEFQAR
jgi:hypothetical protein